MPRVKRDCWNEYEVCAHIMSKGLNGEEIFKQNKDKEKYLELINMNYNNYKIAIIAYCIMNNHIHMILYSQQMKNISYFMHKINTIYAIYYNKKYSRKGFVFQNRFKSKVIDSENYLNSCINYIHLNPVKAGIVKNKEDYKYSSYRQYTEENFYKNKIEGFYKNYFEYKDEDFNFNNEINNINDCIEKYLIAYKIKFIELKKDKQKLEDFILSIDFDKIHINKTQLIKKLEIGRTKFYKILKRGDKKRQKEN